MTGLKLRLARYLAASALAAAPMWPHSADAVPLPKPRPIARNVIPKTTPMTEAEKPQMAAAPATLAPVPDTTAVPPPPRTVAPKKPAAPAAVTSTLTTPQADLDALENVIELSRKSKTADATQTLATISDPIARKLGEWVILRSGSGITFERYRAFINGNPSWPSQSALRRRAEGALWDDRREDALVLGWFDNETPSSAKGKFALARALLNRGDRRGAEKLVRDAWRNDAMGSDLEEAALELFGSLITPGDHKARMDALLYDEENAPAMRAAKRLGSGQVALAKARIAVNDKASNSKAALDAVPHELHNDAGFIFSKIQYLRRQEKHAEAAQLMMSAPRDPAKLHNTNEWWVERRLLARKLLDDGDNRSAYLIARDAAPPVRDIYRTEHEFTAGWIALRFLNDPATAAQHFARIGGNTRNPTAIARAGYWQGRAAEAMGRTSEARSAYQTAAAQSTSYYGQLARAKLGMPQLALNDAPSSRRGSEKFEIVRAVEILYALEENEAAIPIFTDMGERAEADVLAALSELASKNGDARAQLIAGKAALNRGLPFDFHAYPVNGIPPFKSIGPDVEQSIVYAIARQESAFHPTVVSPANAYGLMQVTAGAGKTVTKKYGVGFDLGRLKTDPVYNASLGAAELATLIEDYRGSYILTFAAYNAGRGSVKKWLARYGDPRDPKVDAVDWVERIPFSETRNYVQRIMENVQVYRSRFGGGNRLQIDADLRRGVAAAE